MGEVAIAGSVGAEMVIDEQVEVVVAEKKEEKAEVLVVKGSHAQTGGRASERGRWGEVGELQSGLQLYKGKPGAGELRTNLSESSTVKNITAIASKYHQVSSHVPQFSLVSTSCSTICVRGQDISEGGEGARGEGTDWRGAEQVRRKVRDCRGMQV